MSKAFENPSHTKDAGRRIIEDKAAEARERIGRIEKAATGAVAEAQDAAQAIEEKRMAGRKIADREQGRSDGEAFHAAAPSAKTKGAIKSGKPEGTTPQGLERAGDEEERLTRGHYGAEPGAEDD